MYEPKVSHKWSTYASLLDLKYVIRFSGLDSYDSSHDWVATEDSYEGGDPVGYGRTPQEAIENLVEEIRLANDGKY